MQNSLQDLLLKLILETNSKNPAYKFLLNDYAKYHFVMVILGGISAITLTFLAGYQFHLLRKEGNLAARMKEVSGKANLYLGAYSGFLALAFGLIVIGNLGNAMSPKSGFRNSLEILGNPVAGSKTFLLQENFREWIESEKTSIPAYLNYVVEERLSWQIPKAVISFLLLAILIYISMRLWAKLIHNSYSLSKRRTAALFALGILLSLICTLFLVMAIANTQGSIAPIALSLFFS